MAMRRAALKGSALFGTAAVGIGYYQRVARNNGDPETSSSCIASYIYQKCLVPALVMTDAETAHTLTLRAAATLQSIRLLAEPTWLGATPLDWLMRPAPSVEESPGPTLQQDLFKGRLRFESPFGIAPGFDKNAELVPMYRLGWLQGLGFTEIGSVSALPSEGNARPRCFRVPSDEAVVNRMGLNNDGSEAIAAKLEKFKVLGTATDPIAGAGPRAPIGVNIAKTHSPSIFGDDAIDDFVTSYGRLEKYADYVVLNVSCPNTAEGKTFEDPDCFRSLLQNIGDARGKAASQAPILVKLSPPPDTKAGRETLRTLVEIATSSGTVDGFVIANTAGDRNVPLSRVGKRAIEKIGNGGLSGKPLRARSTVAIREVYRLTGGKVPIIGVGGVDSPESAYEKIRAGASLVEVYTGLVYKGPYLFSDMHVGVRRLLARDGFSSISEAVGVDASKGS